MTVTQTHYSHKINIDTTINFIEQAKLLVKFFLLRNQYWKFKIEFMPMNIRDKKYDVYAGIIKKYIKLTPISFCELNRRNKTNKI